MPLILRPVPDYFRIVGCGYIHGVMDGELFDNEHPLRALKTISIR